MDEQNSKVEQVNQMVRAFCVVALLSTFCFVFAWGVLVIKTPIIGADAFAGVLGAAMTWWFKSRDEKAQERAAATTAASTAATTAAVAAANAPEPKKEPLP